MAKNQKYYVVLEGHTPGIYDNWTDAQKQINGFKGAKFKSFEDINVANQVWETGTLPEPTPGDKKQMYYVVWAGHTPGIYLQWNEAQKQISGFKGSSYKTFGSKTLAHKAYNEGPENYQGDYKKTKDLSEEELAKIGNPIELTLTVDAACNGVGDFEYRGVWNFNKDEVFKVGPYKGGSNNIGEFLALVHALAFLSNHRDVKMKNLPIYSDSRIAMGWVRAKTCRTKQIPPADVVNLIKRAEQWLKNNTYVNPILKWETKVWGEIPADFGRK